jgi:hypothetical protein
MVTFHKLIFEVFRELLGENEKIRTFSPKDFKRKTYARERWNKNLEKYFFRKSKKVSL